MRLQSLSQAFSFVRRVVQSAGQAVRDRAPLTDKWIATQEMIDRGILVRLGDAKKKPKIDRGQGSA
jgi:hypothetical protein